MSSKVEVLRKFIKTQREIGREDVADILERELNSELERTPKVWLNVNGEVEAKA